MLEMESYTLPEKMAKLGIATVEEPVETAETSVAVVSHQNAPTAKVLERVLKRMEKLEADAAKQSEQEPKTLERASRSVEVARVEGDE